MDTFISTTKLILILATVILVADAQGRMNNVFNFLTAFLDVVCKKGRTRKKVMIGAGDAYSFKTQAGAKYAPNTNCLVTYKVEGYITFIMYIVMIKRKKATCPMIMFTCSQFNINNKDSTCKKKDKMTVQEGRGEKKKYSFNLRYIL